MNFLDTTYKRKSAIITSILMLLVVLLLFAFGLGYKDPPDEYGVEVNFGYTDAGSGNNITSTQQVKTDPNPQKQQEEAPEKETPVEAVKPVETKTEEVITQDTEDAPEVNTEPVKETVTKTTSELVKEEPVKETPAPPKPDKSTTDALNSILNGVSNDGTSTTGDGDSDKAGNQGNINENPYATSYYGSGSGNGSGHGLNGRNKLGYKKSLQNCNEEGKVVVKIFVNQNGKVTKTTIQQSDDPCLNVAAKKTAMSYKFNADSKAPRTQTGFVVVNFSLGK